MFKFRSHQHGENLSTKFAHERISSVVKTLDALVERIQTLDHTVKLQQELLSTQIEHIAASLEQEVATRKAKTTRKKTVPENEQEQGA